MDAASGRASANEIRVVVAASDSLRDSLREEVERAGFTMCALEGDAAGAVQATLREEPDVCLVAADLPGSAALLTGQIAERRPQTKVVVVAASVDEDDCLTYLLLGASGYLRANAGCGDVADAVNGVVSGAAVVPPSAQRRLLEELRSQLG